MQNLFEESCWLTRCLPILIGESYTEILFNFNGHFVLFVFFFKKMSSIISIDYILLAVIFHRALLAL